MKNEQLEFVKKIEQYAVGNGLLEKGDRVLVCLSGGADSVCLLRVLLELQKRLSLTLYAAHVNHMLRGADADADEAFCRKLCAAYGVELFVLRTDVRKAVRDMAQGTEAAARQVRYKYFFELKEKQKIDKIATAHNQNDNAETSLMYYLRGSGVDGIKGIRMRRADGVVRPLLCAARGQIETYLQQLGQPYVTDATNRSEAYTRNRIRNRLLPQLAAEFNPNIVETLARNASLIALDAQYMHSRAKELESKIVTEDGDAIFIDVKAYKKADRALGLRVIRRTAGRLGCSRELSGDMILRCEALFGSDMQGKMVSITDGLFARREYEAVRFFRTDGAGDGFSYPLALNTRQYIKEADRSFFSSLILPDEMQHEFDKKQKNCEYFDYNSLSGQIYIRSRKNGDLFAPFGMKGKKKLKNYWIDEKIPMHKRSRIPLVASGKDILWVCGYRRSSLYPVVKDTETILKIVFWEGQ